MNQSVYVYLIYLLFRFDAKLFSYKRLARLNACGVAICFKHNKNYFHRSTIKKTLLSSLSLKKI